MRLNIKKIFKYIKKNQKYSWVIFIFIIFLFLNKSFPTQIISSSDCLENKCEFGLENPTEIELQDVSQRQEISDDKFYQLKTSSIVFGQIFRAKSDFVTGIELDFDVIKQHNNGGAEYSLTLKEVGYKNKKFKIKDNSLAELKFQIDDLNKYKQKNGKYRLPLTASTKRGREYFIGLNNVEIQVDKFNYLVMRGSIDKSSYLNGTIATKQNGETEIIEGDLYFRIFE